jgi:hypothetical protein
VELPEKQPEKGSQEKSLTPNSPPIQRLSLEEFLSLPEEEIREAETIGVYDEKK